MNPAYMMMIFKKDGGEKLKKCVCQHQIKQKDLLEKIELTRSLIFKCQHCSAKINIAII